MTDRKSIESAVRAMFDAMVSKDADTLREVLSEDMRLYHMTGMRQTREEFIAEILDGTLDYRGIDVVSIDIKTDGDRAEVRARTMTDAAVYGGSRHTWRLRMDSVMRKEDGMWRALESRASTF